MEYRIRLAYVLDLFQELKALGQEKAFLGYWDLFVSGAGSSLTPPPDFIEQLKDLEMQMTGYLARIKLERGLFGMGIEQVKKGLTSFILGLLSWTAFSIVSPLPSFTAEIKSQLYTTPVETIQEQVQQVKIKIEENLARYYSLEEAFRESTKEGFSHIILNVMDILVAPNTIISLLEKNENIILTVVTDERLMKKNIVMERLKVLGLDTRRFHVISQTMIDKKFDLKSLLASGQIVYGGKLVILRTKINGHEFWNDLKGFSEILFEVESENWEAWLKRFFKEGFTSTLQRALRSLENDYRVTRIVLQQQ